MKIKKLFLFTALVSLFLYAPVGAFASHRDRSLDNAIDDLDEDIVENLSIPILFGVSVTQLDSNFGAPRDGGARTHEGLDILAPEGVPIVSPTEAVVLRVGSGGTEGTYVYTANPGDETFVYYHLSAIAEDLSRGDIIEKGAAIGFVGDTGNAAGGPAHLHFEIREDGDPKDPFERLTQEFSLSDKIEYLGELLENEDDPEEIAEFLVEKFLNVFIQARAQGIELPEEIIDALPPSLTATASGAPLVDLSLGSQGPAVVALQSILIAGGYLDIPAPTGYFGSLTYASLVSYQQKNSIQPASGYYGPVTRAHMSGTTQTQTEEERRAALLAQIAELTALVAKLQAQLDAQQ